MHHLLSQTKTRVKVDFSVTTSLKVQVYSETTQGQLLQTQAAFLTRIQETNQICLPTILTVRTATRLIQAPVVVFLGKSQLGHLCLLVVKGTREVEVLWINRPIHQLSTRALGKLGAYSVVSPQANLFSVTAPLLNPHHLLWALPIPKVRSTPQTYLAASPNLQEAKVITQDRTHFLWPD